MIFNINKADLLEGIQKTLGIAGKKKMSPILNNVLIRTKNDGIIVVASDTEMTVLLDLKAEVAQAGNTTVSARKLYELLKESTAEVLRIEQMNSGFLKIKADKSTFKLPTLYAADFPNVENVEESGYSKISGSALSKLITGTAYAAASETETNRKMFVGVFFETTAVEGGSIWRMVATNGHLMSIVTETTESSCPNFGKGIIIPYKGVMEIKKFVQNQSDIDICVNIGMLVLKADNMVMKVSLMDAVFPDYRRVIPANYDDGAKVEIEREALLCALKRMRVVASESHSDVGLVISSRSMKLMLRNPDVGDAIDEIDVVNHGDEKLFNVNVDYLINVIAAMPMDNIILKTCEGVRPMMIEPIVSGGHMSIVMPVLQTVNSGAKPDEYSEEKKAACV